jgi:hypothetical protein
MSALNDDLLKAVELALAGQWEAAHELVQQYEDDATAAWIHAVLHKLEGDLGNARYWYRHADRMDHAADETRAELAAIQDELLTIDPQNSGFTPPNFPRKLHSWPRNQQRSLPVGGREPHFQWCPSARTGS